MYSIAIMTFKLPSENCKQTYIFNVVYALIYSNLLHLPKCLLNIGIFKKKEKHGKIVNYKQERLSTPPPLPPTPALETETETTQSEDLPGNERTPGTRRKYGKNVG